MIPLFRCLDLKCKENIDWEELEEGSYKSEKIVHPQTSKPWVKSCFSDTSDFLKIRQAEIRMINDMSRLSKAQIAQYIKCLTNDITLLERDEKTELYRMNQLEIFKEISHSE